jgi:hypothetical protein
MGRVLLALGVLVGVGVIAALAFFSWWSYTPGEPTLNRAEGRLERQVRHALPETAGLVVTAECQAVGRFDEVNGGDVCMVVVGGPPGDDEAVFLAAWRASQELARTGATVRAGGPFFGHPGRTLDIGGVLVGDGRGRPVAVRCDDHSYRSSWSFSTEYESGYPYEIVPHCHRTTESPPPPPAPTPVSICVRDTDPCIVRVPELPNAR